MSNLAELESFLVGSWSNRRQAFYEPHNFAHVVLTIEKQESGSLLLSQRYNRAKEPYRQRVLTLKGTGTKGCFNIYTHKIDEKLKSKLCKKCAYLVKWDATSNTFRGSIKPNQGCMGKLDDQDYVLSADLEVSRVHLHTRDEGLDPVTLHHIWGQSTKPFMFERSTNT
jgi:hypothetical protein